VRFGLCEAALLQAQSQIKGKLAVVNFAQILSSHDMMGIP